MECERTVMISILCADKASQVPCILPRIQPVLVAIDVATARKERTGCRTVSARASVGGSAAAAARTSVASPAIDWGRVAAMKARRMAPLRSSRCAA